MPRKDLSNLKRTLEKATHKLESLSGQPEYTDPVVFCAETLSFKPTAYQTKVLLDESKFIALRWSRQSGKTAIVSAKLLWYAVGQPATSIAIVSPSLRQSKQVLRRIAFYARLLPRSLLSVVQKTRLELTNASIIEAYPNNPDTIRGPSLDIVYCDEMGFIRDDKELYDAILFTLSSAKKGRFIASSTPGSKDNLFYKFCTDPKYGFSNHYVNWKDAVEPYGPLKKEILEMIRTQLAPDPWRWRREMEAEFAENEDSFFPLSLITDAVDQSLAYTEFTEYVAGKRLFAGVDFGKHHDHSAVGVVEHDLTTKMAKLIHMHKFPLETEYGLVIGYVKRLVSTWKEIRKITTDETGIGDVVTEDMRNEGLR
jgi:phage FluMu gp28-like protein